MRTPIKFNSKGPLNIVGAWLDKKGFHLVLGKDSVLIPSIPIVVANPSKGALEFICGEKNKKNGRKNAKSLKK